MDLTASILAATGTRAPDDQPPDGIDILPILRGESAAVERDLYWRIDRPDRQQRAVRAGNWKLLIDASSQLLFDLANDPGERTELAAQRPDVVRQLRIMLDRWEAAVDGSH